MAYEYCSATVLHGKPRTHDGHLIAESAGAAAWLEGGLVMRFKTWSAIVAAALAVAPFLAVPGTVHASPKVVALKVTGQAGGITASLPAAVPKLDAVWCSSPSKCLAVGGEFGRLPVSQVWNGRSWKYVRTPGRAQILLGMSCLSWSFCMAVGGDGVADLWNGAS
jgi:hypothetical protein